MQVVSWSDIETQFAGSGSPGGGGAALLGNGFSTNIWSKFAYSSLLECSPLEGIARDLFAGRANFETVLAELAITQKTLRITAPTDADLTENLQELADQVREGLLSAVRHVHPEYRDLEVGRTRPARFGSSPSTHVIHDRVANYLPRYSNIFTTNYDLLSYWPSVQSDIADLFPGSDAFELTRAENWATQQASKIYFLHGALHLWRNLLTNAEGKHVTGLTEVLLDVVRRSLDSSGRLPLFISEGTSAQKLARISASPYLTFCLRQLQGNTEPLTVLGHSLAHTDQHICDAIQQHPHRDIAIGVWVGDVHDVEHHLAVRAKKLQGRLPGCANAVFFNSAEHPLTDPALACAAELTN